MIGKGTVGNPDESDLIKENYCFWRFMIDKNFQGQGLGKPTVCCIVAGRNVFIDKYADDWDGIVMCYLPGSEAQGITDALCGGAEFTGRLPSPWYSSADQIGTDKAWLEAGWGLKTN